MLLCLDSLWPNDSIWHNGFWSSRVQVMVWHRHLNQCWLVANCTLRNWLWWNFNQNTTIFIAEKAFENVCHLSLYHHAVLSKCSHTGVECWYRMHWFPLQIFYPCATALHLCVVTLLSPSDPLYPALTLGTTCTHREGQSIQRHQCNNPSPDNYTQRRPEYTRLPVCSTSLL